MFRQLERPKPIRESVIGISLVALLTALVVLRSSRELPIVSKTKKKMAALIKTYREIKELQDQADERRDDLLAAIEDDPNLTPAQKEELRTKLNDALSGPQE